MAFSVVNVGSLGQLGDFGAGEETTDYWNHNCAWSITFRDEIDKIVAGIRSNINMVLSGGVVDPVEAGGTGHSLRDDYPQLVTAANNAKKNLDTWTEQRGKLESVRGSAYLIHDETAMWKVKERYKEVRDAMLVISNEFAGLIKSAIEMRAQKIQADWKANWKNVPANKRWYEHLVSTAAWAAIIKSVAITVAKTSTKIVMTPAEIAASIAKDAAGAASKSIWEEIKVPVLIGGAVLVVAYLMSRSRKQAPVVVPTPTAPVGDFEFDGKDLRACKRRNPRWSKAKCMSYVIAKRNGDL